MITAISESIAVIISMLMIQKMLDHTLETMSKEALDEQVAKYGSKEKYREYLASGFANEQAMADLVKWYGSKEKAMEAILQSTGKADESKPEQDENDKIYVLLFFGIRHHLLSKVTLLVLLVILIIRLNNACLFQPTCDHSSEFLFFAELIISSITAFQHQFTCLFSSSGYPLMESDAFPRSDNPICTYILRSLL